MSKYVLFWSNYNNEETIEEWRNKPLVFSVFHKLVFASYLKHNLDVVLLTYQDIKQTKVPKGINISDASAFYDDKLAFKALKAGFHLAQISDPVRLSAAIHYKGIVIDMDAVILRPFDLDNFYASMPAKKTGGFAPKWGNSHPPIYVRDNSWSGKELCCWPAKVSDTNIDRMTILLDYIVRNLKSKPQKTTKGWNYLFWSIKQIIKLDEKSNVLQPIHTCPVPAWLHKGKCYSIEHPTRLNGKTELFGHTLPSIEEILEKSYIVQHFFESSWSDSSSVANKFWNSLHENTLVAREAKFILGDDWRKKLTDE